MFYYLAEFKELFFGLNIFRYITFRAGMAALTTFVLCLILGPIFIKKFKSLQIEEKAQRDDCPQLNPLHRSKDGTPTMGGIFIVGSILLAALLWTDLTNHYVLLTLLSLVWLAVLGGVDDYIKLTQKGKHRGLRARLKLRWQLILGLIIGVYLHSSPNIHMTLDIPFLRKALLDIGIWYIPFAILVIVGTSNAVNLTDGLDGLAIGCVMMVALGLGILSYISGHLKFSEYLFIPYIPGSGELTVICAAILGASLGFLWFNSYPATVFMGDVGSLALGGSLGAIAVFIKKELLLVILGGVFVAEALSVILQVMSFKLTGKRIFKISPLHHHFQLSGWNESKVIIRFWIIAIICALLTLTTIKIR